VIGLVYKVLSCKDFLSFIFGDDVIWNNSNIACPVQWTSWVDVDCIVAVVAMAGEDEVSECDMELIMEAFEMQCDANLQQAIRTVDGLGIEYDENVVCDVCRSVRSLANDCFAKRSCAELNHLLTCWSVHFLPVPCVQ